MLDLSPKQKIWLRVAIYLPLIAYFGYGAVRAHQARRAAQLEASSAPAGPTAAPELQGTKREYVLPDGQTVVVTEMTEDQARAQGFLVPGDAPGATDAGAHDPHGPADADTEGTDAAPPSADPAQPPPDARAPSPAQAGTTGTTGD